VLNRFFQVQSSSLTMRSFVNHRTALIKPHHTAI
jgi:hypothetical protein